MTRPSLCARLMRGVLLLLLLACGGARAQTYTLAVHPVLSPEESLAVYTPLITYLKKVSGQEFQLITTSNFLVYWQMMKKKEFDFVLDGPHFTDYRLQKMGYHLLAKMPSVVSYSLVANEGVFALDPKDMIGRRVATTANPAYGALVLAEIYPNPLRQPYLIETRDSVEAAEKAVSGEADGAMIPTPLVGRYPTLTTVVTTPQVPSPGISASDKVSVPMRQTVTNALLNAHTDPLGQAALRAMNVDKLEEASPEVYAGQHRLLKALWGY